MILQTLSPVTHNSQCLGQDREPSLLFLVYSQFQFLEMGRQFGIKLTEEELSGFVNISKRGQVGGWGVAIGQFAL